MALRLFYIGIHIERENEETAKTITMTKELVCLWYVYRWMYGLHKV